ncbi:hypothetical protein [Azospirillum sp. TSA6c]|uniref:hypothetical protein n=1 Tax=Azospirillum sp. TSA6c TaxID=709813 RepID=UPI0020000683|nr:hypothetical protein [Azospirillum sp. TSA6c]
MSKRIRPSSVRSSKGRMLEQGTQDCRPRREHLAPGEGEQRMRQLGTARDGFLRGGEQPARRPFRNMPSQHGETTADALEQVVEVMGHTAAELADDLHLLRLHQLGGAFLDKALQFFPRPLQDGFGFTLFGYVDVDPDPFADCPAWADQRDGLDAETAPDAVTAPHPMLEQEGPPSRHRGFPGLDGRLGILGMDGPGPSVALVFVIGLPRQRRPAELFPFHLPLGVVGPQDAVDGPDGGPETLLALAQRRFRGPAALHIDEDAREVQRRPIGGMLDPSVRFDPMVVSILATHPVLMGIGSAASDHFVDCRHQSRFVVGMHSSDHLFAAQPCAASFGIEPERSGELLVCRKTIRRQMPEPGADDGPSIQGKLHTLGIGAGAGLALHELAPHHHLGSDFGAGAEQAGDRSRLVPQWRVEKGEVGFLRIAAALDDERDVVHLDRLAAIGLGDDALEIAAYLAPDVEEIAPHGAWMFVRQEPGVRRVVDKGASGTPDDEHRLVGAEHDRDRCLQRRWPILRRAQGCISPIMLQEKGAAGAAFRQERRAGLMCGSMVPAGHRAMGSCQRGSLQAVVMRAWFQ